DGYKQTFNIHDLSTNSVILYPTRAHITREINHVTLKSGSNEVEIYGLSPTVDEHSIQVEGRSDVTVADMTVQLVPNHLSFEDFYEEDTESEEEDFEIEYRDSDDEDEAVRRISKELKDLNLLAEHAKESQKEANERLAIWDKYAKSADSEHVNPNDMTRLSTTYKENRSEAYDAYSTATQQLTKLRKQIKRKEYERSKAGKESMKQREREDRQKEKERLRKARQRAEKTKQARYLRQERLRYWPKKVYRVTLMLEISSLDTPNSSRRGSMDSLSYVTREAGWNPRYDVRISTIQKTATIIYRTEFLNRTSETWKDAKLSFSTSQTSYQGLSDVVPFMHAWRIKLSRYDNGNGGLLSTEEASKSRVHRVGFDTFNRSDLFGLDDAFIPAWQSNRLLQVQKATKPGGLFGTSRGGVHSTSAGVGLFGSTNANTSSGGGSLFGNTNANATSTGGLFGSVGNDNNRPAGGLFGGFGSNNNSNAAPQTDNNAPGAIAPLEQPRAAAAFGPKPSANNADTALSYAEEESGEIASEPAGSEYDESSDIEETTWEDNGLTASYDVPGTRTLAPSSLTRRHKLATLNATNIHLSHICVPKLRSAAFLRAKIRNPSSSITLLKGSAGVTLDGSFLGNMNIPRVSPNQVFDLSLGVDPAIHINYPKPSLHRSTQGLVFNKESAQVFSRSVWLNNTKSQPVNILVLDQVPVSEDERLRILITTPRGLSKEGDEVKAGTSAKEGSSGAVAEKKGEAWGNAKAKLKKNGEIDWTVNLEKGQGCLLKLEYEARLPPSEKIV
ncbi:hypothetical protein BU24DRAFT_312481, partial [Aaosphaeria arxii CBS 175.79]